MVYSNKGKSNEASARMLSVVDSEKGLYGNPNKYIHTKFLIPRHPNDRLGREHLLGKLDEIADKKLALITGPAGYGKTTLASMWLTKHAEDIKSCWVSLDENDNNALRFWQYIIVSINRATKGYMDEDSVVYPELLNGSFELMLNVLINWTSGMNCDIVLIIDDYHLIFNEIIHKSMQYFINHMSENIHIVMISRIIPPLKLARLRGQGKLLELTTKDLKLSFSEISEFLADNMKLHLAENEVRRLQEYTEGWITALKLTALRIKNSNNTMHHLADIDYMNEFVIEYMSEEVFSLLDFDIKEFLQKTSILDTLNGSLCDEVADINNSIDIIQKLEKNNIFISSFDDEKINYRYHSIFREFLRNRLMKTSTDIIDLLYLRASSWYEDHNIITEALEYSEKSNNHLNTARLVEKYGEIMVLNRDFLRVAKLIETLPGEVISENPRLCALYTLAVTVKNNVGMDNILIGSIPVSLADEIFLKSRADLLLIRLMLAYDGNDFEAALKYGNQVIDIMSVDSMIKCVPYKVLCQVHCEMGNSIKAESMLNLYIDSVRNLNYFDEFFIETLKVHMGVKIYCGVGKYRNALDMLKRFEMKMNADNLTMPAIANSIYLDLGYLYYEFSETELSHNSIKKCIELCSVKMDIFRLISGYVLSARIMKKEGNYYDAIEYIRKAEELCDKYNCKLMMVNLFIYIVRTLLEIGEVGYIVHLMNKYNINMQDSFNLVYEDTHFALADYYIATGEYILSESILDKLYEKATKSERNLSYIRAMILKALLAGVKENDGEAMKCMKAAIERASEQRYISTFTDFGVPVADIIYKLLKQKEGDVIVDKNNINYANCLLSHIRTSPKLTFKSDPEIMKCLSKRELEVLKYLRSGLMNREIASKLYVAECTVKKHINNIYAKIGVVNRSQAIQICEELICEEKSSPPQRAVYYMGE